MDEKKRKRGFWDFCSEHPFVTFVLGEEIIRAIVCIAVSAMTKGKETTITFQDKEDDTDDSRE